MGVDDGFFGLERHISQAGPIGRPVGRNDGFGAAEHRLGVLAIGIGQPQVVTAAQARGVGNARGKHPGYPCHFLENIIGDAVRRCTQILCRDRVADPAQALVAQHVPQAVAHVPAPSSHVVDTAHHHHVHTPAAPRG